MSTKSKLLAMTENLNVDPAAIQRSPAVPSGAAEQPSAVAGAVKFPPVQPGAVPRTGPGQMLQFRGQILAAEGELGKLRDQLKEHEGSLPTRKLDPGSIVPSRWANRHLDSFASPEFARLKQDIESAGGNTQAILVRPVGGGDAKYEIVFGHRRHRACLELGIPVLASIESASLSDTDLFSAMDRENRERADLSPFEQGTMYRRALDDGLYPSMRRLAEALGVSHTWVQKVLSIADLPAPIVECFKSPLDIQYRHAKPLSVAYDADRKSVLRRVDKFRQQSVKPAAGAVVDALTGVESKRSATSKGILKSNRVRVGEWSLDAAGKLTVVVDAGVVPAESIDEVLAHFCERLSK